MKRHNVTNMRYSEREKTIIKEAWTWDGVKKRSIMQSTVKLRSLPFFESKLQFWHF